MRDALIMELHQEAKDADGIVTKRLRCVASGLVDQAIEGNVAAAKEIFDRVDGKVPQAIGSPRDDDHVDPLEVVNQILAEVARDSPSMSDLAAKNAQRSAAERQC